MIVTIDGSKCKVTREDADPKFYDSGWGRSESTLLHHVKKNLIEQGYDLIKKLMYKDGHMVDDNKHYLRARKTPVKSGEIECIHDGDWQIRNAAEEFNAGEEIILEVVRRD